jgi:hypothetical protein
VIHRELQFYSETEKRIESGRVLAGGRRSTVAAEARITKLVRFGWARISLQLVFNGISL